MARISAGSFNSDMGLRSRPRGGNNLTLSLDNPEFRRGPGIRAADDREPADTRAEKRLGIARRLLLVLRSGMPGNSRKPTGDRPGATSRGRADGFGARFRRDRDLSGVAFWAGLNRGEGEGFRSVPFSRMAAYEDPFDHLASQRSVADRYHDLRSTAIPAQVRRPLNGENCTVILTDVTGFGARTRVDEDRRIIREALFSMTHRTLRGMPEGWSWDDRGDGLLVVIPPSIPTALVIDQLHRELPAALDEHNRVSRGSARIQLRVAINVGPVATDSMGFSGEAIIVTARLVEARPLRDAMHSCGASLGLIASTFIYETVIRHDRGLTGYSHIEVDVKETNVTAWIKLFEPAASASGQPQPDDSRISDSEAASSGSGLP